VIEICLFLFVVPISIKFGTGDVRGIYEASVIYVKISAVNTTI